MTSANTGYDRPYHNSPDEGLQRRLTSLRTGGFCHCLCATLALVAVGGVAAAETWKHPDAAGRMRVCVSSAYAQQIRVDLPDSLAAAVKGVAAYTPDGAPVPASPVTLGGRTVSVWLALGRVAQAAQGPGEDGLQLPVEIYLFAAAKIPTPLALATRHPARMLRTIRALTTRPFTATEAGLLLGSLMASGRPLYAFDTPALGDGLQRSQGEAVSERRSVVAFWSSTVAIEAPTRALFGSDNTQAAWFIFVDGRPVAEWRQAAADGKGGFWGNAVDLEAGLHSVEFFVIQRHDEPMPACLWKPDGQDRQPLTGSCPSTHPEAVEVQLTAGAPALGIRLAKASRTYFQDTGADLLCFTPLTAAGLALPSDSAVWLDGQALDLALAGQACVYPAPRLPSIELRLPGSTAPTADIRLPGRPVWAVPTRVAGRCQVGRLPVVLAAAERLEIEADVSFSEDGIDPRLLSRMVVSARQLDADGKTLRQETLGAGRRSSLHIGSLELTPNAARVLVEVRASETLLLPAVPIRLRRGGDDLRGLEASGEALSQAGERAVLVCRPLEPLRPVGKPPAGAGWQRLGILDDLCTAVEAPGANLLPERLIGKSWPAPPAVFRETVSANADGGVLPVVAKFAALQRLLEMRVEAIVLSVGAADLRRGRPARDLCQDLLFLAQASAAAGATPILLALPPLPEVAAADSRQAALLCKELAWRLEIPVIDAHSGERLQVLATEAFADTFSIAAGQVMLAGPSDRGREWLYGLMDRALADLEKAPGL
jgi:hypothetical protein